MLYFLKQMHNSDRERLERGQVAFDLKAIHIGEAAVIASASHDAVDSVHQQIVNNCHKAGVHLYVIPLESVFTPTHELIPIDHDGCCPNMQHLQQDLQRLLQVSFHTVQAEAVDVFHMLLTSLQSTLAASAGQHTLQVTSACSILHAI